MPLPRLVRDRSRNVRRLVSGQPLSEPLPGERELSEAETIAYLKSVGVGEKHDSEVAALFGVTRECVRLWRNAVVGLREPPRARILAQRRDTVRAFFTSNPTASIDECVDRTKLVRSFVVRLVRSENLQHRTERFNEAQVVEAFRGRTWLEAALLLGFPSDHGLRSYVRRRPGLRAQVEAVRKQSPTGGAAHHVQQEVIFRCFDEGKTLGEICTELRITHCNAIWWRYKWRGVRAMETT